jgi:rubrerythrin
MATLFNADEVYRIAITLEENGSEFYRAASKRATSPELRALLDELAEWEGGHVELLEKLHLALDDRARGHSPSDPRGELAAYLKALADGNVFRRDRGLEAMLDGCAGIVEMLRLAIRFEHEALELYETLKRLVPEFLGAATLDRLIAEERQHAAMLRGKVFALAGE